MPCVQLSDLPPPPPGRSGWPWTEGSHVVPDLAPDGREWPRVTVVTPSFNQVNFVEETLRSVLLQGYPNLEYLVLDGGSSDGSVDVIEKYSPWIDYWVSEPDGGQSAAINRGLERGTGGFACWINSDDLLHQDALFKQATRIGFERGVVYVGVCAVINADSSIRFLRESGIKTLEDLLRVREIWRKQRNITQAEVLFPRQMALDVGALDVENHYSMDYELWGNLFLAGAEFRNTGIPFGMFRLQPDQKTGNRIDTTCSMIDSALKLLDRARDLPAELRESLRDDLLAYRDEYPDLLWRNSRGRLARMGLPRSVGMPIRRFKNRIFEILGIRSDR
jgi:glycosyltransferase involved in cell wall biosynthesis